MMNRVIYVLLLSLLVKSIYASGTVRLKGTVNQELADTLNAVKQTQTDLKEWEKEMAIKAAQKGLNEQGKEDLSKTSEKIKEMTHELQKRAEAPTVPSMTESESKDLIKAETHLSSLKNNMLAHAGETSPAPPPDQNNIDASDLVAIEKAEHNLKKVEANPVTAPVHLTTDKQQRHEHELEKKYRHLKDKLSSPDTKGAGDSIIPDAATTTSTTSTTTTTTTTKNPSKAAPSAKKETHASSAPQIKNQKTSHRIHPLHRLSSRRAPSSPQPQQLFGSFSRPVPQRFHRVQPFKRSVSTPRVLSPKVRAPIVHHNPQVLGERKGVYSPASPYIVSEMDKYADYSEDTNDAIVAKALNEVADKVKSMNKNDKFIDLYPVNINTKASKLSKKMKHTSKKFSDMMNSITSASASPEISSTQNLDDSDSRLIAQTESAAIEAKSILQDIINNQATQQDNKETKEVSDTSSVENVTQNALGENWFQKAKRMIGDYTDGKTIPNVSEPDLIAAGDGLPTGKHKLESGRVSPTMITENLTKAAKLQEDRDKILESVKDPVPFLKPTGQSAVDTQKQLEIEKQIKDTIKQVLDDYVAKQTLPHDQLVEKKDDTASNGDDGNTSDGTPSGGDDGTPSGGDDGTPSGGDDGTPSGDDGTPAGDDGGSTPAGDDGGVEGDDGTTPSGDYDNPNQDSEVEDSSSSGSYDQSTVDDQFADSSNDASSDSSNDIANDPNGIPNDPNGISNDSSDDASSDSSADITSNDVPTDNVPNNVSYDSSSVDDSSSDDTPAVVPTPVPTPNPTPAPTPAPAKDDSSDSDSSSADEGGKTSHQTKAENTEISKTLHKLCSQRGPFARSFCRFFRDIQRALSKRKTSLAGPLLEKAEGSCKSKSFLSELTCKLVRALKAQYNRVKEAMERKDKKQDQRGKKYDPKGKKPWNHQQPYWDRRRHYPGRHYPGKHYSGGHYPGKHYPMMA